MRSDHWNFLANLLGTPGPAEPPQPESQEPQKKVVEETTQADAKSGHAESENRHGETRGQTASASATETDADQALEEASGESVLSALQEAIPHQALPGFDPIADDRENDFGLERTGDERSPSLHAGSDDETIRATAGDADDGTAALDAAWGDLAAELGVAPSSEPAPPHRASSLEQPAERSPREKVRSSRPKPPKRSSGFGSGLGVELGPEPEDYEEESPTASDVKEGVSEARRSAESDLDQWDEPRQPRERAVEQRAIRDDLDEPADAPRRPSRRPDERPRREESSRRSVVDQDVAGERTHRDEAEGSTRRGGRRGARQRMTEEDLDRTDRGTDSFASEKSDDAADDLGPPRSRGRGRRNESAADEARVRPPRENTDAFDELDDDVEFGIGLSTEAAPQEPDQEQDEASPSRSRRRGRRGRGRGRGRDGERTPREESAEKEIEPLASESAFDDDHEDDMEVEAIRRGRRPRSRGRDREDRDLPENPDRERTRGPRDDDDRPRSRRARGGVESEDDTRDETVRRGAAVPTWIETVELLVNANIENHKKTKAGGRTRGGRRR